MKRKIFIFKSKIIINKRKKNSNTKDKVECIKWKKKKKSLIRVKKSEQVRLIKRDYSISRDKRVMSALKGNDIFSFSL